MDLSQIVVTGGGIVLIALTLWFFFGKRSKSSPAAKEGLYACPMHPWITSNDPGADCSVCGMKLVKQ
ncbi:heavy metal-binding domain-containing protein [Geomonas sp. RF6]|uniref:heavy metal-binding domain-containing protein n=1 Tax=Geomonas sp. RF6 TaxID=2897342 RepID=UPI002ED78359